MVRRLTVILRHGSGGFLELVAVEEGSRDPARPISVEEVVDRLRAGLPTALVDRVHTSGFITMPSLIASLVGRRPPVAS